MNRDRYFRGLILAVQLITLLLLSCSALAADTIREKRIVSVYGKDETWELVWHGSTEPTCSTDIEGFYTCPCMGFAYGETGDLALVRSKTVGDKENFDLAPLFEHSENPGIYGKAVLRKWDMENDDMDVINHPEKLERLVKEVPLRNLSRVMEFDDYDHDGDKTEFLLQVGVEPCGKKMMTLVGVSKSNPKLHAFSSVDHPERPLILPLSAWEKLPSVQGELSVTTWSCGDHGSETETELKVTATAGKIKVQSSDYACTADDKRGSYQAR